ncbi:hypothetical protein ARZXY2_4919 (plasmid) [Arthrobacter sp. ZXY-2]|nr:hypothetical protein ARZXY2_4919 [Arthrobacter sp. ZXY-2]
MTDIALFGSVELADGSLRAVLNGTERKSVGSGHQGLMRFCT